MLIGWRRGRRCVGFNHPGAGCVAAGSLSTETNWNKMFSSSQREKRDTEG